MNNKLARVCVRQEIIPVSIVALTVLTKREKESGRKKDPRWTRTFDLIIQVGASSPWPTCDSWCGELCIESEVADNFFRERVMSLTRLIGNVSFAMHRWTAPRGMERAIPARSAEKYLFGTQHNNMAVGHGEWMWRYDARCSHVNYRRLLEKSSGIIGKRNWLARSRLAAREFSHFVVLRGYSWILSLFHDAYLDTECRIDVNSHFNSPEYVSFSSLCHLLHFLFSLYLFQYTTKEIL